MPAFKLGRLSGDLLHFNAARMRANGSGVLRSTLYSLDAVNSAVLPTITLAVTTNREPTILANFIEQRAYLDIRTTAKDEWFVISKITVFIKPVSTGYPQ